MNRVLSYKQIWTATNKIT